MNCRLLAPLAAAAALLTVAVAPPSVATSAPPSTTHAPALAAHDHDGHDHDGHDHGVDFTGDHHAPETRTGRADMIRPAAPGAPWVHVDLSEPAPAGVVDGMTATGDATPTLASGSGPVTAAAGALPAGSSSVPGLTDHVAPDCSGTATGNSGNRVQAIYAHESGRTDRYLASVPTIRSVLADIDDVFAVSSAQTGGGRRVRWVQDALCQPTVLDVTVSAGSLGASPSSTFTAIRDAGYDAANRKYLVFADYSTMLYNGGASGVAEFYQDASPTGNANDGMASLIARVDVWGSAWTPQQRLETAGHELMHMLGAVVSTAPHHTDNGHCTDGTEMMCYADGSSQTYSGTVCASGNWAEYDCNHDDYFNTDPPAGSYLSTHWNTASSSFLARVAALPAPTDTGSTPTDSTPTEPTPTDPEPVARHATATRTTVRVGSPMRFAGTLTDTTTGRKVARGGIPLALQVRWYGASTWRTLARVSTNRYGNAYASVAMNTRAGTFRFTYAGSETLSAARAGTLYVKFPTRVSTSLRTGSPNRITAVAATLSGTRLSRVAVTLQRRYAGTRRWVAVTALRTSSTGVARVSVHPGRRSYYRWVLRATTTRAAATSRSLYVLR